MRIELAGPSCVGKTTAILGAEALRTAPHPWLGPAEADALIELEPRTHELRAVVDDPDLREFLDRCILTVAASNISPSQKIAALNLLQRSCYRYSALASLSVDRPLVHDELLLHRAFSLLVHSRRLEEDAEWYFGLVPLPQALGVFRADVDTIVGRVRRRTSPPNVYLGLDEPGLRDAVARSLTLADIAAEVVAGRDVPVHVFDAAADASSTARSLHDFICDFIDESTPRTVMTDDTPATDPSESLRERLLLASGSFRKKDGRHELRTKGVTYCAFTTPRFSVSPDESQRDAARRVERFGLTRENVEGAAVLDLGSNAGAMLFQISNFHPASGLGIEYDADKVDLATEIAAYAEIPNLRFQQGDIDQLDAEDVGVHDIVLALAIESHVQDPDRLYRLLGEVTRDRLCFEGNHRCDMANVRAKLTAVGFVDFVDLGFCDDDRDPRNNKRPQLLARKKATTTGARRRLRDRLFPNR